MGHHLDEHSKANSGTADVCKGVCTVDLQCSILVAVIALNQWKQPTSGPDEFQSLYTEPYLLHVND